MKFIIKRTNKRQKRVGCRPEPVSKDIEICVVIGVPDLIQDSIH